MEKRKIAVKNYVMYAILVIVTMLVTFYLGKWYQTTKGLHEEEPIIASVLSEVKLNELENYLLENPNRMLYIRSENKESENILKEIILEYDLREELIYLNLNAKEKETFEKKYNEKKPIEVPNLVVFENKKVLSHFRETNLSETNENVVAYLKEQGVIAE